MATPKYKRILLKLSGEALAQGVDSILNHEFIDTVSSVLKRCRESGVEIAVIVGAGNIWRGRQGINMDQTTADHMGMLATSINALALKDAFIRNGMDAEVLSSVNMLPFAQMFTKRNAIEMLKDKIVIFAGGLGLPYFSTDTAAVHRAAEIEADMVLFAKNIDAIYTADPRLDPSAVKLDNITYADMLARGLKAMDSTATAFAMENNIPILCFGLADPENIYRAVMGEQIGTLVK
ncbi:MAG: UMP kinase [Clostridia bacterium]|nr:UMP kinase [Clostridia bacterium]